MTVMTAEQFARHESESRRLPNASTPLGFLPAGNHLGYGAGEVGLRTADADTAAEVALQSYDRAMLIRDTIRLDGPVTVPCWEYLLLRRVRWTEDEPGWLQAEHHEGWRGVDGRLVQQQVGRDDPRWVRVDDLAVLAGVVDEMVVEATRQPDAIAALRAATDTLVRVGRQREDAQAARDDAVRAALSAGVPVETIAQVAEVNRSRVYQIRDAGVPASRE